MSERIGTRLYRSLVELSFGYRYLVPSQRGRWRLLKLLKKFQPTQFVPGVVKRDGVLWRLSELRNNAEAAIYYGFPYDPNALALIRESVRPGDVAIDVGANVGLIAALLSDLVGPSGRVLAFEPSPIHHESLRQNMELQGRTNCLLHSVALAEKDSRRMHYTTYSSGSLVSDFSEYGFECINTASIVTRRLDDVVPLEQRSRVAFIKIDVDGNELDVLRGARELLETEKPRLLIEVSERTQAKAGSTAAELLQFIRGLGYRFQTVPGGPIEDIDRVIPGPEGSIDVLCISVERNGNPRR